FHPDGKRFASADAEGTVKLWDTRTGRELRAYRGHANGVKALAFSPDGRWLATASEDHTVRVWDATLSARDWHGREAGAGVRAAFERLFSGDEGGAGLRGAPTLSDEARPVALERAQEGEEAPPQTPRAAGALSAPPDGKAEDSARAPRGFEFACR